jgi:hypothetical protein
MAVHQAIQYARSCRLANGRRNSGDRRVSVVLDIHTLMIDELLNFGNGILASMDPLDQPLKPLSGKRGAICERVAYRLYC